jgi:alanyl-tRNA synthetase
VLVAEERRFRELVRRGRALLGRLYPSGRLTEADYEFLRDTHGLPRELVTELLSAPTTSWRAAERADHELACRAAGPSGRH